MAFVDRLLQSPAAFPKTQQVAGGTIVALPTKHSTLRLFDGGPKDAQSTVFLSPDTPCTIEHQLESVIPLLIAKGHRVLSFDIPGSGFSNFNTSFSFTFQDLAQVIIQVGEYAFPNGRPHPSRSCLAFTCASSYPALLAARARPDLFTHVVIGQAPELAQEKKWVQRMDPDGNLGRVFWGQVALWWNRERIARGWFQSALPRGSEKLAGITEKSVKMLRSGGSYCLASMFQAISFTDPTTLDPKLVIDQPAILIWGKQDRTHSKSDPASARKYFNNLVALERVECAHFPDLEVPDKFVEVIERVLESGAGEGQQSIAKL